MEGGEGLWGVEGVEEGVGGDVRREGKLNEDSVHGVVMVQIMDEAQHLVGGDGGRRRVHPTGEAELLAGGDFGLGVKPRGGILADEGSSPALANAFGGETRDFAFQFTQTLVPELVSIRWPSGDSTSLVSV